MAGVPPEMEGTQKKGMSWRTVGIISALMVLPFLTAIFLPTSVNVHDSKDQMKWGCIANLRMIEGAKSTWALENNAETNAAPADADLFGEMKYIREKPACPKGGEYAIGSVTDRPRCSIPDHTI